MNRYLQTLKIFGASTIMVPESMDRNDARIMAELAEGCRDIGRATLCPVTLATIGLPPSEMRAIARASREDREYRAMRADVLQAFKDARDAYAGEWPEVAPVIEHYELWQRNGYRLDREDMNGRYLVDFRPDFVPTSAAVMAAVQAADSIEH